MTPNRPYLIRAIHEWILDNELTPQLIVDAEMEGVSIPPGYAVDGKIVLNVSTSATQGLELSNEGVCFSARFGGKPYPIDVPVRAILAIYARENGRGLEFKDADFDDDEPPPESPKTDDRAPPPYLRIVK